MKRLFVFAISAFSICATVASTNQNSAAESLEIRKEREEKRDQHGKVTAQIDKVFRGNEMILNTVTLLETNKYGLHIMRGYRVDGKEVLTERLYDNGKPDLIAIYKGDLLYEQFARKPDGTLEPMPSSELAELKKNQAELLKDLKLIDANDSKQKRNEK